jgi:hypothetical protein
MLHAVGVVVGQYVMALRALVVARGTLALSRGGRAIASFAGRAGVARGAILGFFDMFLAGLDRAARILAGLTDFLAHGGGAVHLVRGLRWRRDDDARFFGAGKRSNGASRWRAAAAVMRRSGVRRMNVDRPIKARTAEAANQ